MSSKNDRIVAVLKTMMVDAPEDPDVPRAMQAAGWNSAREWVMAVIQVEEEDE